MLPLILTFINIFLILWLTIASLNRYRDDYELRPEIQQQSLLPGVK